MSALPVPVKSKEPERVQLQESGNCARPDCPAKEGGTTAVGRGRQEEQGGTHYGGPDKKLEMAGGRAQRCKEDNKRSTEKRTASHERNRMEGQRQGRQSQRRNWYEQLATRPAASQDRNNSATPTHAAATVHSTEREAGEQQQQEEGQVRGDGGGRGGDGRVHEPGQEKITFLYTNAQSLPGKILELEVVTEDLKPDKILLSETWCNSSTNLASLSIENYELMTDLKRDRNDTANGIGGGLLVYARNGLAVLPCDENSDFNQAVPTVSLK